MARRVKRMIGLSILAAASTLMLAGCGGEGEGDGAKAVADHLPLSGEAALEGGEGESENDNAAHSADPAISDISYIDLLGQVHGHLIAFIELYQGGARDMALAHVEDPESELYASLIPAFEARGQSGFADELTNLAAAANAGGDVDEAYSAVVEAVAAHTPNASIAAQLLAVSGLMHKAASEFKTGVEEDGAISSIHEYQDAYGLLIAARNMLAGIDANDVSASDVINMAYEQIETALAAFNGGLAAEVAEGRPATLYGAASRIETAAKDLM